ncbi:MAG: oligosaccharide flippase family protein [Bacteroidia bacterium]
MKNLKDKINSAQKVTIANMATAGLGFISFFIFVRTLELNVFGEWVLYLTAFNMAEMVRTGLARQGLVHHLVAARQQTTKSHKLRSSAFYLSVFSTLGINAVLLVIYLLFYYGKESGFAYFFLLYPLISVFSLLPSYESWLWQSKEKMLRMVSITFIPAFLFAIVALLSFFLNLSLLKIIIIHGAIRAVLAIYVILSNKYVRVSIFKPDFSEIQNLWRFGRYSIASLLGTNLLKSVDHIIIGFFIGPEAVAIYSVPLKLLEIAEIPARSSGQVLLMPLTKLFIQGKYAEMTNRLFKTSIRLMIMFLPFTIGAFFTAEWIVTFIGGNEMISAAIILQIFLVYVLLMPFDRLLGVSIDSTGEPKYNSFKVWIMVLVNIVGDLVAVLVFDSLALVALATVVNILIGVVLGFFLFSRQVGGKSIYLPIIKKLKIAKVA